jgi:hypothetical protein
LLDLTSVLPLPPETVMMAGRFGAAPILGRLSKKSVRAPEVEQFFPSLQ